MKPIIKTIEHNGISSVSARDLHQFLDVKTHFKDWIKRRIEDYGFVENQDFEVSLIFEQNSKGGRPTKEYILSMDMAKELSMIEKSDKGKQARLYFIACEKRLREKVPNFYLHHLTRHTHSHNLLPSLFRCAFFSLQKWGGGGNQKAK